MLLLAVDTSSAVSAALHDGTEVLAERSTYDPRRHVELLTPTIDEVLDDAGVSRRDITGLVAGTGPGPFTGLRVGLVTARTMGLALGVDVVGVCSLDALALRAVRYLAAGGEGAGSASELVVATDARRREVYWARYRLDGRADGMPLRVDGPEVGKAADVPVGAATCVGRGALLYPDWLPGPGDSTDSVPLDPSAGALAEIAATAMESGSALGPPEPLYLRRPDAAIPKAPKKVGR
ncbi:MAG TPA: tRNA (adenosine(37)-N6)-threonylcarbamoyltransferase complex dimerization subunit type 1 TsaB [Actinomycetales bacterium]|nr:tRNA (adenosine(37)-N6)-threonylcarbamoyltransferase complex dimerization subunit type 1 TsaB [Actinomycetales bacterium]